MHIYFSGIGGTGIGPLALIAKQAGYQVSGSDKQDSDYIKYLRAHGINNISIGQDEASIKSAHTTNRIDWLVYSSAVSIENANSPELKFCQENNIRTSKRDEFINQILKDKKLKMIAIAGTHGKTTTTAMIIWLFKQINIPVSYSVGAKISFGEMGEYNKKSEYFIYEADEFDYNFLAFHPYISLITGIGWDHPDIYPTREKYEQAFVKFVSQSEWTVFWQPDFSKLGLRTNEQYMVLNSKDQNIDSITLLGAVNRLDAWQVVNAVHELTKTPMETLIKQINKFPGLSRRFEQLAPRLYTDYAHTPEKISGAIQTAQELAGDQFVVVYEGLHNTRQHFIREDLKHLFDNVKKLYVVPSYMAREDPNLPVLSPQDIINMLSKPENAEAANLNVELKKTIQSHINSGDIVLCLSAGGGGSLDEWLRKEF